jgi:hypothetical protein
VRLLGISEGRTQPLNETNNWTELMANCLR